MSKNRIYKSGHTYNLHGCQQSPRFINRINNCVNEQRKMLIRVLSRINKLCHFLTNFKQSHKYNLHVCQILSLLSKFGPKYNLEFGSCLEYCSTFHFPYYHKCPYGNVKKLLFLGLTTQITPPPPPTPRYSYDFFHFYIYDSRPPALY